MHARSRTRSLASLALALCVWLIWPAQSLAAALIRFVHAVPGVGAATVSINDGSGFHSVGAIAFGQVSPFRSVRSGTFRYKLTAGAKTLASGSATVGSGVYDIVVLDAMPGTGVRLGVYRAAGAAAHTTLVRVIHAAPELGAPMFMLDAATLASRLGYGHVTRYYAITPGRYAVSAMKPWLMKPGDPTLVDAKGIRFSPGQSYTEIAVGSRGQMVRLVTVTDRGAPLTHPVRFVAARRARAMGTAMGRHAAASAASGMSSSVMVRSGDSLWAIARREVGDGASDREVEARLVAIWNLNARRIGTGDPNLIFPGTRLRLP